MSHINSKTALQRLGALSTPHGFTAISLLFYFLMQHKATASSAPLGEALIPTPLNATSVDPSAELVFEADTTLIDFGALRFKTTDPHQDAMTLVTQSLNTPSSSAELAAALPEDDSAAIEPTHAAEHRVEITAAHASTGVEDVAMGVAVKAEDDTTNNNAGANVSPLGSNSDLTLGLGLAVAAGAAAIFSGSGGSGKDTTAPDTDNNDGIVPFVSRHVGLETHQLVSIMEVDNTFSPGDILMKINPEGLGLAADDREFGLRGPEEEDPFHAVFTVYQYEEDASNFYYLDSVKSEGFQLLTEGAGLDNYLWYTEKGSPLEFSQDKVEQVMTWLLDEDSSTPLDNYLVG